MTAIAISPINLLDLIDPLKVAQKQRKGGRRRLKGKPGRGTLEQEKPPIFGMMQRGGEVPHKGRFFTKV